MDSSTRGASRRRSRRIRLYVRWASSERGWLKRTPAATSPHSSDGIWLRAPYLHNGLVPTLRDLLDPVERRPKKFYRGYDVYNQVKVGFVTSPAEAELVGTPAGE